MEERARLQDMIARMSASDVVLLRETFRVADGGFDDRFRRLLRCLRLRIEADLPTATASTSSSSSSLSSTSTLTRTSTSPSRESQVGRYMTVRSRSLRLHLHLLIMTDAPSIPAREEVVRALGFGRRFSFTADAACSVSINAVCHCLVYRLHRSNTFTPSTITCKDHMGQVILEMERKEQTRLPQAFGRHNGASL